MWELFKFLSAMIVIGLFLGVIYISGVMNGSTGRTDCNQISAGYTAL